MLFNKLLSANLNRFPQFELIVLAFDIQGLTNLTRQVNC